MIGVIMRHYTKINKCRICGNRDLISILNLKKQVLTGVFPKDKQEPISSGPLELVKCHEDKKNVFCGLLQLKQSYAPEEMYGENYGYRSGLNKSMVQHLEEMVKKITDIVRIKKEDLVVDIGSNDGTFLGAFPKKNLLLLGIDPTAKKFKKFYPKQVTFLPEFFSPKPREESCQKA